MSQASARVPRSVSLATVLTPGRLRSLAGYAYPRGEAYWRDGRVVACELDGDTLDGVVVGTTRYRVMVSIEHGQLVTDCTCPVADDICKHAVALVLYHLDRTARATAAKAAPPADAEPMFATRKELEAYAAQHHAGHALALSATILASAVPPAAAHSMGLGYLFGRLSIRDLGSHEGAVRHVGTRGLAPVLAAAAMRVMERAAACVRTGIGEETASPSSPPDPALAPLWSKLVIARGLVRAAAFPRSRASRATGQWELDRGAVAVMWREPDRVLRSQVDWSPITVVVRMVFPGDGAPTLECTCGAQDARCTHSLALIDATLDRLADPGQAAESAAMAALLLRPGWARALDALDGLEAATAKKKPRPEIELWWRIERELGSLTVTPIVKKLTRRGTTTGARMSVARLIDDHGDRLAELDRRIAEAVLAWDPGMRSGGTYPLRAVCALVDHPRVVTEASGDAPVAIKQVALGFTAVQDGDQIRLAPTIDGERISANRLATIARGFAPDEPLYLEDPDRECCLLIEVSDDARALWTVLDKHGDGFPPESHAPLLDRLARLEARLPVVVPEGLMGPQLPSETTTVLRLRLLPDLALELELYIRPGPGAPMFQPGSGPKDVMLLRDGARGFLRRALTDEPAVARAALDRFALGDAAEEGPPFCWRIEDPQVALAVVAAIQEPVPGVEAEWVDRKPSVGRAVGPRALALQIDRKRDWFGITGQLTVEQGRLELAVLLDAARQQQRFVRVDANRWVELSDALRQRLLAVADQTFATADRLELSPGAVAAIEALADAGAEVATAPAWQQLTGRLAEAMALTPTPPAALAATLRDYQVEGHAWLSRLAAWGAGACLADDMGLGKTVQAIAVLIDRGRLGPALVLAPTSVAYNWVQELQRFAPGLRPVLFANQSDRAACLAGLRANDVLIVSYGLLVRDATALAATRFATLVIDEAQAVKNPATRRARAARKLDAEFRIALSGTPFENHLGELWSLFAIVFPGLLGSWDQFRDRFATPIEKAKDPAARAALSRVLRPFLLRRTKGEVARELPSRTEIQVPVALSEDEWGLYEDARLAAVAALGAQDAGPRAEQQRFQVLAALTRLRLLASHPRLYDPRSTVASAKLRRLLELLEELRAEGHRVLVFSQFTAHLALVRDELVRAGFALQYLDGATPAKERAARIAAFQAGTGDVFLISLKAGGTGINLTAADYVIHLDPWWNPAVEDQATDRAHRIGQTRPVTVFRLIARGTIEEQIVALHGDKRALVSGVLDGTDVAARLTTQDLLALLAAGDRPVQADDDEPEPAPEVTAPPRRRTPRSGSRPRA
jgi:superfamily II DNA or RNA helicase